VNYSESERDEKSVGKTERGEAERAQREADQENAFVFSGAV
jgi:hypothetical protein